MGACGEETLAVYQQVIGMMHYILDARTATPHFPGIGRYVANLARAMTPLLAPEERLTFLYDPACPPVIAASAAIRLVPSPSSPFSLQPTVGHPAPSSAVSGQRSARHPSSTTAPII